MKNGPSNPRTRLPLQFKINQDGSLNSNKSIDDMSDPEIMQVKQARDKFTAQRVSQSVQGNQSESNDFDINASQKQLLSASAEPLDKENTTKAQGIITDHQTILGKLNDIKQSYDPKFLTRQGKLYDDYLHQKKAANLELTSEEQADLEKKSAFDTALSDLTNEYVKQVGGARALSNADAYARVSAGMPNSGMDSAQFKSAFQSVQSRVQRELNQSGGNLVGGLPLDSQSAAEQAKSLSGVKNQSSERELHFSHEDLIAEKSRRDAIKSSSQQGGDSGSNFQ